MKHVLLFLIAIIFWLIGSAFSYFFYKSSVMQENAFHHRILWSGQARSNGIVISLATSWLGALVNGIDAWSGYGEIQTSEPITTP